MVAVLGFLVLCRIPSLSLFRWSFKYIPYYGAGLILLGTLILSRPLLLRLSWRRTMVGIGLICVLAAVALASSMGYWRVHLFFWISLCAGLAGFYTLAVKPDSRAAIYALAVSAAVIAASCGVWRRNTELPDPGLTADVKQISYFGSEGHDQTVLNTTDPFCCDPVERSYFAFGSAGFLSKNRFINGYSTMQPASLHRELCVNHAWGLVCNQIFERIFRPDETTGETVADLMGLDIVAMPTGKKMHSFTALAPREWRRYRESDSGAAYRREAGIRKPGGTLSWVPESVRVSSAVQDGLSETLQISVDPSDADRRLIFSRSWYPGYRARLDGREIEVTAHRGYIVSVRLPKDASGESELELYYRLPGMPWTGLLAALGLLLAALVAALWPRNSS
jgi:hypothetical protein